MNADLNGLRFVVAGGSGSLGAAVIAALKRGGAEAFAFDRAPPRSGDQSAFREVNLTNESAVAAAYAAIGPLDGSIHVTGGFAMSPIAETSLTAFEEMWRLNAVSCFLCCREAVKAIRGSRKRGRIVNVAARPVLSPVGGMIPYSASKASVASITQSLAAEVLAEGILVNAVLPSIMDTPANRAAMPKADHSSWPTVSQVADAICWLAGPGNAVTSGALLPVYGRA